MQKDIPTRTASQIRTHAQKFFIQLKKKIGSVDLLEFVRSKPASDFIDPKNEYAGLSYEIDHEVIQSSSLKRLREDSNAGSQSKQTYKPEEQEDQAESNTNNSIPTPPPSATILPSLSLLKPGIEQKLEKKDILPPESDPERFLRVSPEKIAPRPQENFSEGMIFAPTPIRMSYNAGMVYQTLLRQQHRMCLEVNAHLDKLWQYINKTTNALLVIMQEMASNQTRMNPTMSGFVEPLPVKCLWKGNMQAERLIREVAKGETL